MDLLTILATAVGLAMDATAVAVATSITLGTVSPRQVFRFAFHFGLFQALMPVLGWLAGRSVLEVIAAWDHWIVFALLTLIGGKAILEARAPQGNTPTDPTRGWSLVFLSIATSIDALAVGLSFGVLDVPIIYPCVAIGLITAALTVAGMLLGSRIGQRFGQRMRVLGGLVLIGIGVKVLIEHLS